MSPNTTFEELRKARQELIVYRTDFQKFTADLLTAKANLISNEIEKVKQAKETSRHLEEMMFTVSHKIRKSVANILGITHILREDINIGVEELKEMLDIIIDSADSLNLATEELTTQIYEKKKEIDLI